MVKLLLCGTVLDVTQSGALVLAATRNQRQSIEKYLCPGSLLRRHKWRGRIFCVKFLGRVLIDCAHRFLRGMPRSSDRSLLLLIAHLYQHSSRLLRIENRETIYIPSNFGVLTSPMLFAANRLSMTTVYFPHSRLSKYYKHFRHSVVFLDEDDVGSELAGSLGAINALPAKARVVDDDNQSSTHRTKDVLVALSLIDNPSRQKELFRMLRRNGLTFDLRAHPREKRISLFRYRARTPISSLTTSYRIFVSSLSSSYFELQETGVPTYLVNLTDMAEVPYVRMPKPMTVRELEIEMSDAEATVLDS